MPAPCRLSGLYSRQLSSPGPTLAHFRNLLILNDSRPYGDQNICLLRKSGLSRGCEDYAFFPPRACRICFENVFESSSTLPPKSLLSRAGFLRRKWLFGPRVRTTRPVPVMWNRFLAPLCVFIFGISSSYRPGQMRLRLQRLPQAPGLSCSESVFCQAQA